jgi:GAF domain
MTTSTNLDHESFQQLLANAFAVQESQMDRQVLAAVMEVQRLIMRGELGAEGAMLLAAEAARDAAGAAGVAIGLLEGDQLLYRAGSGCCAAQIGSGVAASLTASAHLGVKREILRVENARTDTRIEAAICRQLGAESLLILPIYQERALAGVMEILFGQAHAFEDREVRIYRLMAGLIELAMLRPDQGKGENSPKEELTTLPDSSTPSAPQGDFLKDYCAMSSSRWQAVYDCCGAALAVVRESQAFRRPGLLGKRLMARTKEVAPHVRRWDVIVAGSAAALGLTFWIAYLGRGPGSRLEGTHQTAAIVRQERTDPAKVAVSAISSASQAVAVSPESGGTSKRVVRRTRAGRGEIDYIGDDVTVRHFTYKPATQRRLAGKERVAYIGEDVTVRYLTP